MYFNQVPDAVSSAFENKLIIAIIASIHLEVCEAGLRILGGRDALKDEFPFAVRLEEQYTRTINGKTEFKYVQLCTGAALSPTWILTAAHCDHDAVLKINQYQYITSKPHIFARYNSYFPKELGQLSPITKVLPHPGYSEIFEFGAGIVRVKYDIALFQTENIIVSQYAKVSGIDYTSFVGHEASLLGFGGTNATPTEKPLQVLKGMLIQCDVRDGPFYGMLCVVPLCGLDAISCGGDSGGPVVHASGVVGVIAVIFGYCDEFGHDIPPGYSSTTISMVSPVIDWISSVTINKTES